MKQMKLLYKGKTKDVYQGQGGTCFLQFKDDVTGEEGVFDPGANRVGLSIQGMGKENLRLSVFFFEALKEAGIATHYLAAYPEEGLMEVKRAVFFGKGLEVICRYRAVGSFIRRYGAYVEEGSPLDAYTEFTLKDDERGDPLITCEGLEALGILDSDRYRAIWQQTRLIAGLIRKMLEDRGLELYDIKLEFGLDEKGELMLIDEVSSGNMRVYDRGRPLAPLDLAARLLERREAPPSS